MLVVGRRPELSPVALEALLSQSRRPDRVLILLPEGAQAVAATEAVTGAEAVTDTEAATGAETGLEAGADAASLERALDDAGVPGEVRTVAPVAPGGPGGNAGSAGDLMADRAPSADGWLWWLHDDGRPAPEALRNLLLAVEASPSVTIAGCKQVEAERARHILDVGLTVTPTAEPIGLIEPGELDQGQFDARSDTLAVSAPGMLVRSDVWESLGGFDPRSPEPAAAVDLCWRNRLAGHRVVVVPRAVMAHHGEGEGLYAGPAAVRESAQWLRLKHAPAWAVPMLWLWGVITGLGAFAVALLAKEPGRGLARLAGTGRTLARVLPLARSRRQAGRTRTAPRSIVDPLRASGHEVRTFRRSVLELESPEEIIGDGTGSTLAASEPTGGHDDFAALATPERNWVGTGLVIAVLALGGLSLVGLRELLTAPALAGGSLLPVTASVADLWAHATGSWAPAGAGAAVQPGPFGLILLVLGLTGQGSAVLLWLTVLAMPLAAAGAWLAAGAVARNRGVRLLAALIWGLSPALLTAAGEGRPGSVLVHLALPWLVLAVIRATGSAALRRPDPEGTADTAPVPRPGHRGVVSWTASGWTALLLAGIWAAAPSLLPVLTASVLVLAATLRRRGRALWWTPLPGLALFLPAAITHWRDPRALLGDPGVPQAFDPAPLWQQLLGFPHAVAADSGLLALPWLDTLVPGLAGTPWALVAALVVGVPVLVAALVGALSTGRTGVQARIGLGATALGLLGAAIAPLVGTSIDSAGRLVTLHTGPHTSLALLGVLVAAVAGLNALLGTGGRGPRPGMVRPAAGTRAVGIGLSVLATASVLLLAAVWIIPRTVPEPTLAVAGDQALAARTADGESAATLEDLGTGTLLTSSPVRQLPATAADQGNSALAVRTLVLERGPEEITVSLAAGSGPALDRLSAGWTARSLTGPLLSPAAAGPDAADEQLRSLAGQLTTGSAADPRPALEALGAGFVVLRDATGAEGGTAASIDSVPGLAPVGLTDSGWLWRVVPEDQGGVPVTGDHELQDRIGFSAADVRIVDGQGATTHLVARDGTTVDTTVPAAEGTAESEGRQVVLAERADAGWQATLDGEPLGAAPVPGADWAQGFDLPAEGGQLRVWHSSAAAAWSWWLPLILLVLAALLAVPSPARRLESRSRGQAADGRAATAGEGYTEGHTYGDDDWRQQR